MLCELCISLWGPLLRADRSSRPIEQTEGERREHDHGGVEVNGSACEAMHMCVSCSTFARLLLLKSTSKSGPSKRVGVWGRERSEAGWARKVASICPDQSVENQAAAPFCLHAAVCMTLHIIWGECDGMLEVVGM